jgi:hypothetical protein
MRSIAATIVALAIGLATPAAARAAVAVDPPGAPRGQAPEAGWYDRDGRTLYVGKHIVPVDLPGEVVRVRRAATGFLLQRVHGAADLLDHVSPSGATRRLAREVLDWEVMTGEGAGRKVAVLMAPEPGRVVVRVLRASDGKLLAVRPAPGHLHDFHQSKVWMDLRDGELATWNPVTGAVVRTGISGAQAVDARNGAVARRAGGCLRIAPLRRDADWKAWCAAENGFVGWSPQGRHVLTHTLPPDDDGTTHKLVVRQARTGKQVQAFTGYLGLEPDPRWESERRFVVAASDPEPAEADGAALVRLRVGGAVVRVSRLGGTWPWEVRRVPVSAR